MLADAVMTTPICFDRAGAAAGATQIGRLSTQYCSSTVRLRITAHRLFDRAAGTTHHGSMAPMTVIMMTRLSTQSFCFVLICRPGSLHCVSFLW